MRPSCLITAMGLVCCASDNAILAQHTTDIFQQVPADRVDILFVIDDSRSMTEEQQALADGFTTFLDELERSETDWQIGVTSTSVSDNAEGTTLIGSPPVLIPGMDTVALFRGRALLGIDGSDQEKGLDAAARALDSSPGFVRAGANLVVIFVTDEDDCSDDEMLKGHFPEDCYLLRDELVAVETLVKRITNSKWGGEIVRFGGILGPLDSSCEDTLPGNRYMEAVNVVGGALGRICDPDWTPVLHDLGAIASGILEQFTLSEPAHLDSIEVFVDDNPIPPDPIDGWTYDAQSNLVTFHGAAIPERSATIRVEYEVAPGGS